MIAKDYLRRLALLSARIKMRQEELEDLNTARYSIGYGDMACDRVQTSGPSSRVEESSVKYLALEEKLHEMIDEYILEKHKIISLIESLEDDRFISILYLRYVKEMTWEAIEDDGRTGYCQRQIQRLHGLALVEFQKLLDKNAA